MFVRRSWVDILKESLPDYATDLKQNLDVITSNSLTEIDAHTCAVAAAMASGNGELVIEINHSTVLMGNPIREEVSLIVSSATMNSCLALHQPVKGYGLAKTNKFQYVSKAQEYMYHLVTYVVRGSAEGVAHMKLLLQTENASEEQICDIIKIAAVITAVGRTII